MDYISKGLYLKYKDIRKLKLIYWQTGLITIKVRGAYIK